MSLTVVDHMIGSYPPVSAMRAADTFYDRSRDCWVLCQPKFSFRCRVGFERGYGGGAPPPGAPQLWRVGLVQNVLYEWIRLEYDNWEPIEQTWSTPVVDYADREAMPFVTGARSQVLNVVGDEGITIPVPVRRTGVQLLWYSEGGLLPYTIPIPPNPYDTTFPGSNRSYELEYEDAPFTALRARLGRDDVLLFAGHVMAVQFWVMALTPTRERFVLAHSPAFTLMARVNVLRPPPGLAAGMPRLDSFEAFSVDGLHRHLIPRPRNAGGFIAPIRGPGGRRPVITGVSANARARDWLHQERVAP